ncbi:hypothetical protein L9F63_000883, partial [Diploptera punctata]
IIDVWEKIYIQKNKYKAMNFDISDENNLTFITDEFFGSDIQGSQYKTHQSGKLKM